jgi:hypothetical protein
MPEYEFAYCDNNKPAPCALCDIGTHSGLRVPIPPALTLANAVRVPCCAGCYLRSDLSTEHVSI